MAKVCFSFQDIIDTVRLLLVKCVASVAPVPCLPYLTSSAGGRDL